MNTFKLVSNKIKTLKMAKNLLLLLPLLSGGLGAPHPKWMSQNKELGSIYQETSDNYNRDAAIFTTSKSLIVVVLSVKGVLLSKTFFTRQTTSFHFLISFLLYKLLFLIFYRQIHIKFARGLLQKWRVLLSVMIQDFGKEIYKLLVTVIITYKPNTAMLGK